MSYEEVSEYLRSNGAGDGVIKFECSSATVELAAAAIGCKESEIAKSISVLTEDGGALIVCSGDMKLDNKKFKERFGRKPSMVPFDDVEQVIGHRAGGVCPFCLKPGVKVYLDESLRRFSLVYAAAGSEDSVVGLELGRLEELSKADGWVDVCKPR